MKIMELDVLTLEKLRKLTEPSNVKEDLDYSTFQKFKESIDEHSPKLKELVVLQTIESVYLLVIKNGKYYNYFSGAEVFFFNCQITRLCLIAQYSKEDIQTKSFIPLPPVHLCKPSVEYVDNLIKEQ